MTYTVKQLADMAGVSTRTLHYYDQIGLLTPSEVGANGYRQYHQAELYRLQQILFYKELGLELKHIQEILDQPGFNLIRSLEAHKSALEKETTRLLTLLDTVKNTINHLKGAHPMSDKELFAGWSEEKQVEYEKEAMQMYDPEKVKQSSRRWKNYTREEKDRIQQQGGNIFQKMAELIPTGPTSEAAQAQVKAYQDYVTASFYDCTPEIIGGLGQAYTQDPRFQATFDAIHPDLAEFTSAAFTHYAKTHAEK
ncbi:MerR family transcriptional regulator [bacterium]|nr:MerR family transcriptional regulator [bacterium]MCB2178990.1 MerR family transcriptional regulator [bacterium]